VQLFVTWKLNILKELNKSENKKIIDGHKLQTSYILYIYYSKII